MQLNHKISSFSGKNPLKHLLKTFKVNDQEFKYYDVESLGAVYSKLPFSIRVLLESAVRNCDNFQVKYYLNVEKSVIWAWRILYAAIGYVYTS